VEDALGDGLVQLAGGDAQLSLGGGLVAGLDELVELAHLGANLRADGLVAQASLLVGLVALDLGLDVSHVNTSCIRVDGESRTPSPGTTPGPRRADGEPKVLNASGTRTSREQLERHYQQGRGGKKSPHN